MELGDLIHPGLLLGFSLSSRENIPADSATERKARERGAHRPPKLFRGEKRYPTHSLILKGFRSNNSI